jgi:hypothetical protein
MGGWRVHPHFKGCPNGLLVGRQTGGRLVSRRLLLRRAVLAGAAGLDISRCDVVECHPPASSTGGYLYRAVKRRKHRKRSRGFLARRKSRRSRRAALAPASEASGRPTAGRQPRCHLPDRQPSKMTPVGWRI